MNSNYPRTKKERAKEWFDRSIGLLPASLLTGACMAAFFYHIDRNMDEKASFSPIVFVTVLYILPLIALREIWVSRHSKPSRKAWLYGLSCVWASIFEATYLNGVNRLSHTLLGPQDGVAILFLLGFNAVFVGLVFTAVYGFGWLKKLHYPTDADYGLEPEDVALPTPMMPSVQLPNQNATTVNVSQEAK